MSEPLVLCDQPCHALRRAEVQDLQEAIDHIRKGEFEIPTYASYINQTVDEVSRLIEALKDMEASHGHGDVIRHLRNILEQMNCSRVLTDSNSQLTTEQKLHHLNTLDTQCSRLIFQVGMLTIPARVNMLLCNARPGYYIPFHAVFEDELPNPDERAKVLSRLLWQPMLLKGGLIDSSAGLIYKYAISDFWKAVSFLLLVAAITLGTDCYALLGLLALYSLSTRYFGPWPAFMAVLGIWFGTPYVNYLYFEPAYAHVLAASLVALFIWSYLAYRAHMRWIWLLGTGALAGLMVLTRWQNAVFLIIPLIDMGVNVVRIGSSSQKHMTRALIHGGVFISIVMLLFTLQMLAWRQLYGHWLTVPMGSDAMRWFAPALLEVLFSARNGLLAWTPLVAVSVVGLVALYRHEPHLAVGLTIALLAQWWVNASVADWWGGSAFGSRRFIDSSVVFALGLAGVLHWMQRRRAGQALELLVLTIAIGWNLALWSQYTIGSAPIQSMHDLGQIYWAQFTDGFPELYRLLGRSTWLDLALRSGLLRRQWANVRTAALWASVLAAMAYLIARCASGLGMSKTVTNRP
jgi:hypothetical protein